MRDAYICERIQEEMRARGATQSWLSHKTGIAQPQISRYISGKSVPSYDSRVKIAEALGITQESLLVPSEYGNAQANKEFIAEFEGKMKDLLRSMNYLAVKLDNLEKVIDMLIADYRRYNINREEEKAEAESKTDS